jgi:hypothetical protein
MIGELFLQQDARLCTTKLSLQRLKIRLSRYTINYLTVIKSSIKIVTELKALP